MRKLLRTSPVLLALGIAVMIGCSGSNVPVTKAPPSQSEANQAEGNSATPGQIAATDEYVLTVEGMT